MLMLPFAFYSLRLPTAEDIVSQYSDGSKDVAPEEEAAASARAAGQMTVGLLASGREGEVGGRPSPEWLTVDEHVRQLPEHLEPLPPVMRMAPMAGGVGRASPTSTDNSVANAMLNSSAASLAPPTLLHQLHYLLTMPAFVLLVLGYAAFTATVMGVSSFGPLFMLALNLDTSEVDASFLFGLVVAFAGVLGTPLGGMATDIAGRRKLASLPANTPPGVCTLHEARSIVVVIWWQIAVGATMLVLCAATVGSMHSKWLFLLLLFLGVFFTFGTSAGITRTIMLLVPPEMRSFAVALNTMGIHILGDVPSPIIVGALKDAWAPNCGFVWHNDTEVIDPDCHGSKSSQDGLVDVLLCATAWMFWAVVTWFLCIFVLDRNIKAEAQTYQ